MRRALASCLVLGVLVLAASAGGASGVRQVPVSVGWPPLKGTLTLPAGKGPFPAVVLVSGSGQVDQDETVGPNKPFRDIALGLAAKGIASVRYDKRTYGYPKSVDPRTFTAIDEWVPDALAAIRLLRGRAAIDRSRIFVLGHSWGGSFAPLIAKRAGRRVAGLVLAAPSAERLGAQILRQWRYLATLPGATGAAARAKLPEVEQLAARIDGPELALLDPGTIVYQGAGPAYYLSFQRYDGIATARSLPQPILILQGERDYQVTVRDDLVLWQKGLAGRKRVRIVRFPGANHFFLDGSGPSTPLEYSVPGHVDAKVAATVAAWIASQSD